MATYNSPAVANKNPIAAHGYLNNVQVATAVVTCTASPATTDTMNFFYMPKNAVLLDAYLSATDMDTNGSPALALNIGDAGSASRLFAASTVGQAGTAAAIAAAGRGYQYTAKTLITGTASTNAATGAAGTVTLTVLYYVADSTTS